MPSATLKTQIPAVLQRTVLQAGNLLRRSLPLKRDIQYKGEKNLVTEMDKRVEALFAKTLQRFFPDHLLLSEEMAETGNGDWGPRRLRAGQYRWIVDPVDGTTNYAHGFPHFCVSVGVEDQQGMLWGAVYNPMLREFYLAHRGHGAWCNGRRIHVSRIARLAQGLLSTGFPYDLVKSPVNNFYEFEHVSKYCQAVRRAGSAALDLCDVACGRFDAFWEYKLKPWDVAAGSLILTEAGGRLTDFKGKKCDLFCGNIVASNGLLHRQLCRILSEKMPDCRNYQSGIKTKGEKP